jgi:hypothetical protein
MSGMMMSRLLNRWWLGMGVACLAMAAGAAVLLPQAEGATATAAQPRVGYNQYIRPILSENCFFCHGPDRKQRKAKLRLDDRDVAIEKGAIVPGNIQKSKLISRIFSVDKDEHMPPEEAHKTLSEKQKELLKLWIAQGAEYEPHWAYIAPRRPQAPAVKNAAWVKNPIDAFVLAELEAHNLAPSHQADKAELLRRLSLDLIGLPPTPAELQAFLADTSPDAYEKQVDRLLASRHFGERIAVPWLDDVRFADTVGFHGDQNQNVFPYRDYVINSFNQNKPFDQFTIEQIAGDLLPHPTTEQLVASCYNRLNMITREGGAQPKEYLAKYTADRVRTVAVAWLGSTMQCCECHDHKYDPFTARDFYSMGAFWADVKQWGVYMDYNYTPNPDLRGFSNDHPFPPEIVVDSPYLKQRIKKFEGQLDELVASESQKLKEDPAHSRQFAAWRGQTAQFLHDHPDGWKVLAASGLAPIGSENKTATKFSAGDGAILLTAKPGVDDRLDFPLIAGQIAAVRIELLPREQHGGKISRGATRGKGNPDSINVQIAASIQRRGGASTRVPFWYADADRKEDRFVNGYAVIGVRDGWKTSAAHADQPQTAVYLLEKSLDAADGDTVSIRIPKSGVGCVRVSVSPIASLKPIDPTFATNLDRDLQKPGDSSLAVRTFLLSSNWDGPALAQAHKIEANILECRDGKSPVLVTESVKPMTVRVLPRGNWQDESGAIVEPATPHFLPALPNPDGHRLTRLDLGKWLVSPQNPLTARVFVDRLWKQFFGCGIVNSVEDFGSQGEWPSHPELLDWLASEFEHPADSTQAHDWDVKHIVRLIVTSAAYRQDSNLRPELKEIDPANRLLASQNPRRLEAEFVRDNALKIAGLLEESIGGPSVFPYQPQGYYANIQFPNRDYYASPDERQYRRGVYMHWQRTFLHPMLANFDAPSREDAVCTRNVSNTPQQALTLLNDPEFVEASRVLAEKILTESASDEQRLDALYERALCRHIKAREQASLTQFLQEQRSYYKEHPDDADKLLHVGFAQIPTGADAPELASWANTCRVVLNLHETITRY